MAGEYRGDVGEYGAAYASYRGDSGVYGVTLPVSPFARYPADPFDACVYTAMPMGCDVILARNEGRASRPSCRSPSTGACLRTFDAL